MLYNKYNRIKLFLFILNARGSSAFAKATADKSNGSRLLGGLPKRQGLRVLVKVNKILINTIILFCARGSSNGRTSGSGPENRGSNPCPRAQNGILS